MPLFNIDKKPVKSLFKEDKINNIANKENAVKTNLNANNSIFKIDDELIIELNYGAVLEYIKIVEIIAAANKIYYRYLNLETNETKIMGEMFIKEHLRNGN